MTARYKLPLPHGRGSETAVLPETQIASGKTGGRGKPGGKLEKPQFRAPPNEATTTRMFSCSTRLAGAILTLCTSRVASKRRSHAMTTKTYPPGNDTPCEPGSRYLA